MIAALVILAVLAVVWRMVRSDERDADQVYRDFLDEPSKW